MLPGKEMFVNALHFWKHPAPKEVRLLDKVIDVKLLQESYIQLIVNQLLAVNTVEKWRAYTYKVRKRVKI